mmetsp:Transcript_52403/g.125181  ORF Transcript_52403/g.125181 Transcript_52403/m.125181 type:complete len:294 (+) Transcript_52403:784-1665(+)
MEAALICSTVAFWLGHTSDHASAPFRASSVSVSKAVIHTDMTSTFEVSWPGNASVSSTQLPTTSLADVTIWFRIDTIVGICWHLTSPERSSHVLPATASPSAQTWAATTPARRPWTPRAEKARVQSSLAFCMTPMAPWTPLGHHCIVFQRSMPVRKAFNTRFDASTAASASSDTTPCKAARLKPAARFLLLCNTFLNWSPNSTQWSVERREAPSLLSSTSAFLSSTAGLAETLAGTELRLLALTLVGVVRVTVSVVEARCSAPAGLRTLEAALLSVADVVSFTAACLAAIGPF